MERTRQRGGTEEVEGYISDAFFPFLGVCSTDLLMCKDTHCYASIDFPFAFAPRFCVAAVLIK